MTGEKLVVGLVNGEILIYDSTCEKLKLIKQINTRQSTFKSLSKTGMKVTGIEFLNPRIFIATTNDSRIRIFELKVSDKRRLTNNLYRPANCYINLKDTRIETFPSSLVSVLLNQERSFCVDLKKVMCIYGVE